MPFPGINLWRSKPVPILVENFLTNSKSSLKVIFIFEDLPRTLVIFKFDNSNTNDSSGTSMFLLIKFLRRSLNLSNLDIFGVCTK